MVHYFHVLDRGLFSETLCPALASCWRQKSFTPVQAFCQRLSADATTPRDALVRLIAERIRFDRHIWQALVGECLILGANSAPRLETAPRSLLALLTPERLNRDAPRRDFSAIEQIHYGSRDLHLGKYYRSDFVGWNDADDIQRLTAWMRGVDPATWNADDLARLPDFADADERAEELAYVKDWWPPLVELYAGAEARGEIIVCERT